MNAANASERLRAARRSPIVIIVVVAFVVRVAWAFYAMRAAPVGLESAYGQRYFYYGQEIARGHGYISYETGEDTAFYPIGFPAILAAVFWPQIHTALPDHFVGSVAFVQIVAGTAAVWLVFVIGRTMCPTAPLSPVRRCSACFPVP